MKRSIRSSALILAVAASLAPWSGGTEARQNAPAFPRLQGPYLGQSVPDAVPRPFAPGIVSCGFSTRDVAMTPDGGEIFFSVSAFGFNSVFHSRLVDGAWTEPALASFARDTRYMTYEPHISPDGKQLLFLSDKPRVEGGERNQDLWAAVRSPGGWGEPVLLGGTISTDDAEFFPSLTRDGTLYFTRQPKGDRISYIFRSRRKDGAYGPAEKLGPEVNCGTNRFNAFVDPDERFLIVPSAGMPDSVGDTDYYVVFRNDRDEWSRPVNMGRTINTPSGREFSASLSPDGKYLFFMTTRPNPAVPDMLSRGAYLELLGAWVKPGSGNCTIYWVDAGFIARLRPSGF